MQQAQPGHIDHIKRNNLGSVYKLIDLFGPISRIELSKQSALAPASITKISRELIEANLVQEAECQESGTRGRPATGLVVSENQKQILSLRLGRGYLTIALHELSGAILVEQHRDIEQIEEQALLTRLCYEINMFFTRYNAEVTEVCAIAITLPGQIDSLRGIVHQMPHYQVSNFHLAELLFQEINIPVFIDNDIQAWALAERLFGHTKDVDNTLLISAHHGVGAGIILDGRVLRSGTGNLGELGHMQIEPNGKRCYCGNIGCLDTVVNWENVENKVKKAIKEGQSTVLTSRSINIDNICYAAKEGDVLCVSVIQELGEYLGKAIAMMVNIFNPDKILIGGEYNIAKKILYSSIMKSVKEQALPFFTENLEIAQTDFYTESSMAGAALVKQRLYDGDLLVELL
ncbi:ROK family protein [Vibrio sp. SS-MA-C1-2]|uniref:sugar metabolism global transcriptional regulator Mlc n=1 Tax=Vibrio sp. SS-MA-C1-2 TaxID=2908646 RepID=UPI001F1DE456|nr:ROK family protein [Vibrio sp. SS-MA-C1-2]UJF18325.1 ROK family protein [Vibrio sp. SS-MA-C1-2]